MLKMNKEKINNTKYEIDSYRSMLKDKLIIQMVKQLFTLPGALVGEGNENAQNIF